MDGRMRDAREHLGLGPEVSPDEIEATYRDLEALLSLTAVPRRLKPWATDRRARCPGKQVSGRSTVHRPAIRHLTLPRLPVLLS